MEAPALPHQGAILAKCLSVIALVAAGRTPTRACDESGISWDTFNNRCGQHPELLTMFQEAIQRGYDVLADILLEIDTNPLYGSMNPAMAKVLSENIKWYLSRKQPDKYGEKVQITHSLTADRAIIEALEAAKQRAFASAPPPALPAPMPAGRIIDITPVRVLTAQEKSEIADLY